jgi:hypothetical protein
MEIKLVPTAEYPIVLMGIGIKRWERLPQDAFFEMCPHTEKMVYGVKEWYWDRCGIVVWVDRSSEHWGPSSIQRESRFGFLFTKRPLMFCCWFQFKPQGYGEGGYIPGSETVFYWRVGAARWDPNMGGVVKLKFKLFGKEICFGTWYGPGLHWD